MEKREHHFESFGSNGNFPRGKLLKNVAAERKVENIIWIWEGNSRNLAQSNFQGMAGSRESALLWKLKSCWFFSSIQEKSDASSKRQWVYRELQPHHRSNCSVHVWRSGIFPGYQLSTIKSWGWGKSQYGGCAPYNNRWPFSPDNLISCSQPKLIKCSQPPIQSWQSFLS